MCVETEELTAYEKRMLQLAERQTDSLELLRVVGIAVVALLLISSVVGAVVAFS
jgi:hypothetical protein